MKAGNSIRHYPFNQALNQVLTRKLGIENKCVVKSVATVQKFSLLIFSL